MAEEKIGKITHYFGNISVGIIGLSQDLKLGDKIKIKGAHGEIEQTVDSMQIDRQDVSEGKVGQEVGVKVSGKIREGDEVFKIE